MAPTGLTPSQQENLGMVSPITDIPGVDSGINSFTGSIGSAAQSLTNVDKFFSTLTQKNTWIRVGEVVIGGGILFIGLSAMFQSSNAGRAATGAVKKTVGGLPFL